ncbi:MAG: hypothetical protein J0G96_07320 [Flavobacteriia bacterium]|nr:hypothetical protein [Flavobacteriia bacterium]OJX36676.1 MAG: hypothetical protein BGO87_12830 [Flavobacteriia bacterium 40-80]
MYTDDLRKRVEKLQEAYDEAYKECLDNPTFDNIQKRNSLATDVMIAKSRRDNYGKNRAVMETVSINNLLNNR